MAIIGNGNTINRDNNNPNNSRINEKERNSINNSNNIRNAANVAMASHNPYAKAAGAGVKALDKATGGKSTDALGKLAARTTQRMPGGKNIQDASNKLSESGASNKIASLANKQNDKVGNGPVKESPKNDVGAKNLQKSKANRASNILKNRYRKRNESNNTSDSGSNDSPDNNNTSDNDSFKTDDLVAKAMKRIRIKIVVSLVVVMVAIVLLISSFLAIFGINVQFAIPAASQKSYGTSQFTSVYEKGTKEYKNEIKYYNALEKASKDYESEHGEPLKTNYIHSILIYIYYQFDSEDEDLENLENSIEKEETSDSEIAIDYEKMTGKIDDIVSLMTPSDSKKNINYEKKGEFYNSLKNSSFIRDYYRNILKNKSVDDLLDEIFDLANEIDSISFDDDTVITSETEVSVKNSSSSKSKISNISMTDYISGSIYANNDASNQEKVKAYTILYSTNLVASNKTLTVNSTTANATNEVCSIRFGCSYDENGNLVTGAGAKSDKNNIEFGGRYYYKKPLTSGEVSEINKSIESVYGNVLVDSNGTYPIVDVNVLNGLGDENYNDMLKSAYSDYTIKDVGEDSYIKDGSYGSQKVQTSVIFYDQNNYKGTKFCGISNENIKTSGCGTTAMAIVVSTFENNRKYDPVYMMNRAHTSGYCGKGISGTSPGFFKKEAGSMKYKYLRASKRKKSDLNLVLKHLSQGHLVITHMRSGHFTSGGHYMVLGGVDPANKKVYVYDPNNASNKKYRKSGNGWYNFNDIIVKESFNYFYIIWKG